MVPTLSAMIFTTFSMAAFKPSFFAQPPVSAMLSVAPVAAQNPETSDTMDGSRKVSDHKDASQLVSPNVCDTLRLAGIVPPRNDSSAPASVDTILIEYDVPDFAPDGMISPSPILMIESSWVFPSEYGTFRSYLHRQLKANPDLREWIRTKINYYIFG